MVPVKLSRTCCVRVDQNARQFSRRKAAQRVLIGSAPAMTRSVSGGSRDARTAFHSFRMLREY